MSSQQGKAHLHRYVGEFSHRHNVHPRDTEAQMAKLVRAMDGRHLPYCPYCELVTDGTHARKAA